MGLGSVVHVVGARPNFVAMAPIIAALEERVARIEGWDGHAGERAAEVLALALKSRPAEVFA
jgi:UDP-N-acetylglucosamine 2-epimerase